MDQKYHQIKQPENSKHSDMKKLLKVQSKENLNLLKDYQRNSLIIN